MMTSLIDKINVVDIMENWQKWKDLWLQKPLKEQFEIAVTIGKSLPRDRLTTIGHKNVLKFYAYYKQATR